jgi:hypothetical protein
MFKHNSRSYWRGPTLTSCVAGLIVASTPLAHASTNGQILGLDCTQVLTQVHVDGHNQNGQEAHWEAKQPIAAYNVYTDGWYWKGETHISWQVKGQNTWHHMDRDVPVSDNSDHYDYDLIDPSTGTCQ